ncbi:MAG: D-alanyl-D-alanine carboxypeptidase [Clostridium sp.]|jgi:serine-type D-ala-D-ala carboxypeptidase|nr:D-alanyl-D-alanine carboxypeptidase [Clostridium sp.]MEE0127456.1 serine hydrolase [Clostridia bacterium]
MKFKKFILCLITCIVCLSILLPVKTLADNNNLNINAESAILIDGDTGKILYEKSAYEKRAPASTTKIMTALLALEHCKTTDVATVTSEAITSVPSGYSTDLLKMGEELTIKDLLYALLLPSSNEAANVLAIHIAGSIDSFASMMNTKAMDLGCKNTHFVNPNGVHDDNHYSTAYDLSLIAKEAMKNDIFRQIVSTASYTLPNSNKYSRIDRTLITTNDLIKKQSNNYYEYAIGIKTGFTTPAKNCLVSSATKDGKTLIAVVLRSNTDNNRYNDTKTLFNYGFDNFSKKDIVKSGSTIKTIDVKNATSATKNLNLVAETGINTMVTNDKLNDTIEPQINLNEHLQAPIKKDSIVGTATYTVDNIKYTINLKAGNEVKKSYTLYLVIAIAIIALLLIIFEKPNKKKKRQTTRRPVKKSGYHKAR